MRFKKLKSSFTREKTSLGKFQVRTYPNSELVLPDIIKLLAIPKLGRVTRDKISPTLGLVLTLRYYKIKASLTRDKTSLKPI